jgi:hypothetical protein
MMSSSSFRLMGMSRKRAINGLRDAAASLMLIDGPRNVQELGTESEAGTRRRGTIYVKADAPVLNHEGDHTAFAQEFVTLADCQNARFNNLR